MTEQGGIDVEETKGQKDGDKLYECPYECGAQVVEGIVVCPQCGHKIIWNVDHVDFEAPAALDIPSGMRLKKLTATFNDEGRVVSSLSFFVPLEHPTPRKESPAEIYARFHALPTEN